MRVMSRRVPAMALVVTGAALRARFRHDDAYDGPPGVQASPYVGVV